MKLLHVHFIALGCAALPQITEANTFSKTAGEWALKEIEIPVAVNSSVPTDDFTLTDTEITVSDVAAYDATINDPIPEFQSGQVLLLGPALQEIGFLPNGANMASTFFLAEQNSVLAHIFSDATSHILAVAVKEPNSIQLAELEGTWVSHFIEVPRTVIGGQLSLPFDTAAESVAVDASGGAGGAGTFSIVDGNRVNFLSEGENELFVANEAKDVLMTSNTFTEGLSLAILTRSPDSLTIEELAGTWQVLSISVPNVTDFLGQNANNSDFEGESGEIVINDQGEIQGPDPDIITINPDNTVTFTDVDNFDATFSINASKDVMVASFFESAQITFQIALRLKEAIINRAPTLVMKAQPDGSLAVEALGSGALELLKSTDLKNWELIPVEVDGPFQREIDPNPGTVFYQSIQ